MERICTPAAIGLWTLVGILAVGSAAAQQSGDNAADVPPATKLELNAIQQRGAEIYRDRCADCHGPHGEGAEGAYEDPLIGDESIGQLASRIDATMPEGSPEDCQGEEARAVAEYIYHAFYSEAAQLRNRPPRVLLTHLTTAQLRQSLADLYSLGASPPKVSGNRGLSARYYNGDRRKTEEMKLERVDPAIDFDWQRNSPVEGVDADSFFIEWNGGLTVPRTGRYEIIVRSTCSFIFYLGASDRWQDLPPADRVPPTKAQNEDPSGSYSTRVGPPPRDRTDDTGRIPGARTSSRYAGDSNSLAAG